MRGPQTVPAKALIVVFVLIALWLVMPTIVKRLTRASFVEFQAPVWSALSFGEDVQDYWSERTRGKDELIEAGIEMARLNAAHRLRSQQFDYLSGEVQRLEGLLDLPPEPQYRYEVARVIRRDLDTYWQQLIIRKGSAHGLAPGQGVIAGTGVIGRIDQVFLYTSTVTLLTDPSFRSAAHLEGDLRPIQFQGGINNVMGAPRGLATIIPPEIQATVDAPIRLVSSRLGGVFPDGLTMGHVFRLEPGADGLFQQGIVRIAPPVAQVREVAILVPLGTE